MVTYTTIISPIPKPVSEDHVTQYIRIRLAALKTNPEAFGSTHAGESAFPHKQWCERVNNPARTTLFAMNASSPIIDASLERDHADHESKWIGTLSVLAPEMLRGVPFPKIAEAEGKGDVEIYMLTGMWVHPGFRKGGVGRQLVEHALQVVRNFSVVDIGGDDHSGDGNGRGQRFLLLEVNDSNIAAQRLYENLGFVEQLEATKGGRKWMAISVMS